MDGKILASGSYHYTIILWDVETHQPIGQPFYGGPVTKDGVRIIPSGVPSIDSVDCLAFSPDGKILASGSENSWIFLWDVETRKPIGKPLPVQEWPECSTAFSPDSKILLIKQAKA